MLKLFLSASAFFFLQLDRAPLRCPHAPPLGSLPGSARGSALCETRPKPALIFCSALKKAAQSTSFEGLQQSLVYKTPPCPSVPCLLRTASTKGLKKGQHVGQREQTPARQRVPAHFLHQFTTWGVSNKTEDHKCPKNAAGLGALNVGNSFTLNNQVQTDSGYRGVHKGCLSETGHENPGASHVTPTTLFCLQEAQICSDHLLSLGGKNSILSHTIPELKWRESRVPRWHNCPNRGDF